MFSVVIPLYNKELSIKNTIQSVLNQSYQNFEIIVINDGSTDESEKIVESINDERIRLIQQKNKGVSAARNRGIQEASNEWIAFLDGDDLWEKEHLQEITTMMQKFPEEKIFVTSFEYSDKRYMFKHERRDKVFKIENYFKEAIRENLIWTSIIVVNKNCFNKTKKFNVNLNRGEDLDLWARLARNHKIIKSTAITATYRVNAENRTSLSKNIEKTLVYHLNLNSINTDEENEYYRFLILRRCNEYLYAKDFKNLIKLKKQHPEINFIEILSFSFKNIIQRIKRVKKKFKYN